MRKYLVLALAMFLVGTAAYAAAAPATAKKSSSSKKKTAPSATRTPSRKAAASKRSAVKSSSSRKRSSRKTTAARRSPSQRTPSPDRYRDIQQALQAKGYFDGEPDGNWGPSSVAALKRFQSDQSLEPTGRINSLSLIALGLGPKHDKLPQAAEAPPVPNP